MGALLAQGTVRKFLIDGLTLRTALLFLFVGAAVVAQFGGTQHLTFPFVVLKQSWMCSPVSSMARRRIKPAALASSSAS